MEMSSNIMQTWSDFILRDFEKHCCCFLKEIHNQKKRLKSLIHPKEHASCKAQSSLSTTDLDSSECSLGVPMKGLQQWHPPTPHPPPQDSMFNVSPTRASLSSPHLTSDLASFSFFSLLISSPESYSNLMSQFELDIAVQSCISRE